MYYKKKVLFKLKDENVFEKKPFTWKSILNTAPFRPFLGNVLEDMSFKTFGDLPFKSFVIVAQRKEKATFWANNQKSGHAQLDPTDLFMASTSIPILLPSQKIKNTNDIISRDFPRGNFIDGGSFGDFEHCQDELLRFVTENGTLEELHIISPMRETLDELENTRNSLKKEYWTFQNLILDWSNFKMFFKIGFTHFLKFVIDLNEFNQQHKLATKIFISIPAMKESTGILSFGAQEETYYKVHEWLTGEGKDQLKLPIANFLEQNQRKT